MPLYIQTNISSLEAQRNLNMTQSRLAQSFQRLSSGFRINSAADDAAGLAVSESLKSQIRSYAVAERNANNAISMATVAEGSLSHIGDILSRMRELAVQASNGDLNTTDRGFLSVEFEQLRSEIDRISSAMTFNGIDMLNANATSVAFQVGINNNSATIDRITVTFAAAMASSLGLSGGAASIGGLATNAQAAIASIDAAFTTINTRRADLGAVMSRFSSTIANLQSVRTNLSAANSRIRDVDVAEETSQMARMQIIQQAGAAVLAQANQQPQLALGLLRQ